jgi:probable phosphoglycerate mutase
MMRIILVRHGNTFAPGEPPRRVGAITDLPLVEEKLGTNIGKYLAEKNIAVDFAFVSPLQRTIKTLQLIENSYGEKIDSKIDARLMELDYGVDEGKLESDVIDRIGNDAITRWNSELIVPNGWNINTKEIIDRWNTLLKEIENDHTDRTVMLISSNGFLRFIFFSIVLDERSTPPVDLKLKTGSLSILSKNEAGRWYIDFWNLRP